MVIGEDHVCIALKKTEWGFSSPGVVPIIGGEGKQDGKFNLERGSLPALRCSVYIYD